MSNKTYSELPHRAVITAHGEDVADFLQGLVSNDVTRVSEQRAVYAAMLTPQGKFLFDLFIVKSGETWLLECERERAEDLRKRLAMYKLRAKVVLADGRDDFTVYALWGDGAASAVSLDPTSGTAKPLGSGAIFVDPRLAQAGLRAIVPTDTTDFIEASGFDKQPLAHYDRHRIELGLADGSRDMAIDKAILLENGFDELDGVHWDKGCYMGQELTARTKYRGLIKKRLLPVAIEGPTPAPGTPIMAGEREAGEMRTAEGDTGLALIRLEFLQDASELHAGESRITPRVPEWAKLP